MIHTTCNQYQQHQEEEIRQPDTKVIPRESKEKETVTGQWPSECILVGWSPFTEGGLPLTLQCLQQIDAQIDASNLCPHLYLQRSMPKDSSPSSAYTSSRENKGEKSHQHGQKSRLAKRSPSTQPETAPEACSLPPVQCTGLLRQEMSDPDYRRPTYGWRLAVRSLINSVTTVRQHLESAHKHPLQPNSKMVDEPVLTIKQGASTPYQ